MNVYLKAIIRDGSIVQNHLFVRRRSRFMKKLSGKKAELAAIHAGLECGYWDGKRPGMDIISVGPNLYDVHSTKEKVSKDPSPTCGTG